MKKLKYIIAFLMLIVMIASGCNTGSSDIPEGNVPDINPNAQAANKDTSSVRLYFSYNGENLLAGETRTIDVPISESLESAVINALIAGPTSDELTGLFWEGVELVGVDENANHVFVTLSKEFVETDPKQEKLLDGLTVDEQKKLAIYSIVNTIIEIGNYSKVQIYVEQDRGIGQRIKEYQAGWSNEDKALDPLARDSSMILTPANTLIEALSSFHLKDWKRLHTFTANMNLDGTVKPQLQSFSDEFAEKRNVLETFNAIDTTVSSDGQSAVVMLNYSLKTREGKLIEEDSIPIVMVREKGLWKVTYSSLVNILINV